MVLEKSPFPEEFLGVDLLLGGVWQEVDTDLEQSGVSLSHGVRSEGGSADVSQLTFTVRNGDGKYSARNPVSPLYGEIGRNTPARARVALGAPWLDLTTPGARATTPDTAALSITGDLDVRWWGERDSWGVAADLMAKYSATGNQRSWILRAEANGTLALFWSADGTNLAVARSLEPVPAWAGRIALRATLDVNNGAGGRTVRFEYAADLDDTWVQLGEDIVSAGVTSVYNSTAPLTLGKEPTSSAFSPPQRVYGWELSSGGVVASSRRVGTLVAGDPLTDDQGNAWTITSGSVSNTHILAVAEVAEWPVEWGTKGAESVLTEVEAAGVTRRLGQGAPPVESVLYRAISATVDSAELKAYWPMEDGENASLFGAAVGSRSMSIQNPQSDGLTPATYEAFPGSAPFPTMHRGRARSSVDRYDNTGEVQVRWVQWTPLDAVPVEETLVRVEFAGGTIAYVDMKLAPDGDLGVFGYDEDGNDIGGGTFVTAPIGGTAQRISLELSQSGSNVFWRRSNLEPGEELGTTYGQNFASSETLGRVSGIVINPRKSDLGDIAIGHVSAGAAVTQLFDGIEGQILVGYAGEDAGARIARLASENGVPLSLRSQGAAAMGEQQEETLLDLVNEAAEADGGILHDDPRALGLRYRSLYSLGSQPAVTIPYQDNLIIPFRPTDDDGMTRNHVTVSRTGGSRNTHELTEGPMSVQPAPDGVGMYDEAKTLNLHTDNLADRTAAWRLHIGTWDASRYPRLGVDLAHPALLADPDLTRDLLSLMPGDRLTITDPPPWLPPRTVDVIVQGVEVEVTPLHLMLQWSCVPARPHRVAYWNAGHRWSGTGTVTNSQLDETATQIGVVSPSGIPGGPMYAWHMAMKQESQKVVAIGDSITEGAGASTVTKRWQSLLQKRLSPGGPDLPFIPAWPQAAIGGTWPVTQTGSVRRSDALSTRWGLGWRTAEIFADDGVVEFTFTGTSCKIMYSSNLSTGVLSYSVDGGAFVDVNTNGPINLGATVDVAGLGDTAHTVQVKRSPTSAVGQSVWVHGLVTFRGDESSGTRVLDAGHGGIASNYWVNDPGRLTATFGTPSGIVGALKGAGGADLMIYALGTNDWNVPASNHANNFSFETDGDWFSTGSVESIVQGTFAPNVLAGTYAAVVTATAAPSSTGTGIGLSGGPVTPGQWVRAKVPVRPAGAIPTPRARVRIQWFNASNVAISSNDSVNGPVTAGVYTTLTHHAQAPAGAVSVRVYLFMSDAATAVPLASSQMATDNWTITFADTEVEILAERDTRQFRDNTLELIDAARASTADAFTGSILLLGMYLGGGRDPVLWGLYHDRLAEIAAADSAVRYVDLRKWMPPVDDDTEGLYADTLHPSDAGHARIADAVADQLGLTGWTHVDGDYDVVIGGEQMTVTDVDGSVLSVTRSVNGVVKEHPAGSAVELADPSYYAR